VSRGRRILVATVKEHPPATALRLAGDLAGRDGEVVLAAVLVVPHAQPLEAALDRPVAAACAMLDEAERTAAPPAAAFDTRLIRARSFAEGVLETLGAEAFDVLMMERGLGAPLDGAKAQVAALFERAGPEVMIVRAALPGEGER
jgi:nucleotide-binding universal stress UspA family protein